MEKDMNHTRKEKCRYTNLENSFNLDFSPHELFQDIASLKTERSPDPYSYGRIPKTLRSTSTCHMPTNFNPCTVEKAIIISMVKAKKPASELSSSQLTSSTSIFAKTMEING
jgi:hypothetical protein